MYSTTQGENSYDLVQMPGSRQELYDDVVCRNKAYEKDQDETQRKETDNELHTTTKASTTSQQEKLLLGRQMMCIIASVILILFLISTAILILVIALVSGSIGSSQNNYCTSSMQALPDLKKEFEGIKKSISKPMGFMETNLTSLWLAVNSTSAKLEGFSTLWTAVNASKKWLDDIMKQVKEMKSNGSSTGFKGPPGHNGTRGSQGLPGPPGIGSNITLCTYKTDNSPGKTAGRYARNEISVTETKGKKFLGVNCDTNDARVCLLSSTVGSDKLRAYKCSCENTLGTGVGNMYCYVHYWECQTNT